jgi:hypothetical protein
MYLSSSRFLIVVLCVLPILRLSASRWEKLEACELVTVFYNDGDSFRVKHEGDEYNFRLYFVDTPERGLFYPDRIKEQADYFGSFCKSLCSSGGEGDYLFKTVFGRKI